MNVQDVLQRLRLRSGYLFCVSVVLLFSFDRLAYQRNWASFCNEVRSAGIPSGTALFVMVDIMVISLLYIALTLCLIACADWVRKRVLLRDRMISRYSFAFNAIIAGLLAISTIAMAAVMATRVHSLAVGIPPPAQPTYVPWHRYFHMAALFVLTMSSALVLNEVPLNRKNKAFWALLYVAVAILFTFLKQEIAYYYMSCITILLSAFSLQRHIERVERETSASPEQGLNEV